MDPRFVSEVANLRRLGLRRFRVIAFLISFISIQDVIYQVVDRQEGIWYKSGDQLCDKSWGEGW